MFVIELPYMIVYFIEFNPPSYDEVQALCETANSLLCQNRLLMQQNKELTQRNRALIDQVARLSEIIRRGAH